jgi:predicted nucleic acid-binding protein
VYAAVNRHGSVATANIAYAEMYAGMTRKYREGLISQKQYEVICKVIEDEWRAFIVVELDHDILERARDVIKRYPLRGFDAIHLASALTLKSETNQELLFLASDQRLLKAASAEQLSILDPEKESDR